MFSASIRALPAPGAGAAPYEMVEHKGRGHPDTLCDALAENLSITLSRFYLERFGEILHHNVDKALLLGGALRLRRRRAPRADRDYASPAGRHAAFAASLCRNGPGELEGVDEPIAIC